MKYYINAQIYTLDEQRTFIKNGYLKVEGNRIKSVGTMEEYQKLTVEPGAEVEDAKNKIIMPGMVCTHSHFYGQLIRGMAVSKRLRNWQHVLHDLWWTVDRAMDEEINYASAMMGVVEGVKCGVTTFVDHHASPACCMGSLDTIEEVVQKIGARAVLAYETSDRNGEESRKEGLAENARFIEKCAKKDDTDTVRAMFGLHALYSVSEKTLQEAVEIEKPYDVGFHIHCAEDKADVVWSYKNYDVHVVEKLEQMGILTEKSILAHFVNTSVDEWEIVKKTGTTIAHNAQSNASNSVGICPVKEMLGMGVHVGLGGDGFYYNLFEELKIAALIQRIRQGTPEGLTTDHIIQLAFTDPYRVVQNAFNTKMGSITEGSIADFIMVDYDAPTPLHEGNFISHMVDAFTGHVTDTIINGKRVVKNGIVLNMPEGAMEMCRKHAARLEKRYAEM